ncbi:MAG: hypothetical protein QW356_00795 [Candidatus Hadarchaeales archaeon]
MLTFMLYYTGFLWWSRIVYAVGISEGTYYAGVKGGGVDLGNQRLQNLLGLTWSPGLSPHSSFSFLQGERAVVGRVEKEVDVEIPFMGGLLRLRLSGGASHRRERFYGGPPQRFE